ncbi:hypothetical protein B9479_003202 [Cryptococcus floricola]|uniref:Retrotransposon Copia-like N-terminal domain-containing protein n=1 Tax=Cryptococcus floricola TaxID=2591691 RepID=A0A5D3AZ08_9TREE|nr:hypothetical protein B9479_003202 [Cryptococcus floricola]
MENMLEGIPILEGPDNYHPWAASLVVCLAAECNAKRVLLGLEKEPYRRDVTGLTGSAKAAIRPPGEVAGDAFPPVGARTPSDVSDEEMRERWEKWAEKERKARCYLILTVSENMRGGTSCFWSSAEIWEYFEARFDPNREGEIPRRQAELASFILPPNSNASTRRRHLQRFENILNVLEILGEPMLEENKIRAFFRSLGDNCGRIRALFISKPPSEQTWIHLTRLINFDTVDLWPTRRGAQGTRGRGRRGKRGTAAYHEKHDVGGAKDKEKYRR